MYELSYSSGQIEHVIISQKKYFQLSVLPYIKVLKQKRLAEQPNITANLYVLICKERIFCCLHQFTLEKGPHIFCSVSYQ